MKPVYRISLGLTEEDKIIVDDLRKNDKISLIAIFRKGLEFYAPKVPKKLIKKAKGLVKK